MKKMSKLYKNMSGFTLIELIVVMLVIAIITGVAVQKIGPFAQGEKIENTRHELNKLAIAIVGNPDLVVNGYRTDFGYIGDIGSMPPDLDALAVNPGFGTWKGPYISDDFASSPDDFKKDAWNNDYIYVGGIEIRSYGPDGFASGDDIVRRVAGSARELLLNNVSGNIYDLDGSPPGFDYRDSVIVRLSLPDGSGGTSAKSSGVDIGGFFAFDSIPVGRHRINIIYLPVSDSLTRFVNVTPGGDIYGNYHLDSNFWAAF